MVKELGAQPSEQNTIAILMSVPWSFKLIYGFTSDTFKLFGYRRKSYLFMGYIFYAISMLYLAYLRYPTVLQLAANLFLGTVGIIMADVSADTMIVERSQHEPEHKRGQAQATCYSVRFFGSIIGSFAGCILYNKAAWGWGLEFYQVCAMCGLLPLAILIPAIPSLYELEGETKPVNEQLADIWSMVQLKAVWRPMSFIYIYNLFQVPNVAWSSYLQLTLKFPAWFIGFIGLVGSLMTFCGIVVYKKFFFKSSWRSIYLYSSITTFAFSCLQICLIFQINERIFGISNYPFAMGDDVLQQFLAGIQFLPACVMYMGLCPKGSEGATYSMLTTFGNIALTVAGSLGTQLGQIWDVSNTALKNNDLSGLWKLALLTSLVPILPLFLLYLIPANQKMQKELQKSTDRSVIGGVIFLSVLVFSLVSVFVNAYEILSKAKAQQEEALEGVSLLGSGNIGGGQVDEIIGVYYEGGFEIYGVKGPFGLA